MPYFEFFDRCVYQIISPPEPDDDKCVVYYRVVAGYVGVLAEVEL